MVAHHTPAINMFFLGTRVANTHLVGSMNLIFKSKTTKGCSPLGENVHRAAKPLKGLLINEVNGICSQTVSDLLSAHQIAKISPPRHSAHCLSTYSADLTKWPDRNIHVALARQEVWQVPSD